MVTTLYLGGGMRTGWQDTVKSLLHSGFIVFDPRDHDLSHPSEYTVWDLHYIKRCDVFLGYMESDNPGGYNLAYEIATANAFGALTILVDARSPKEPKFARYFQMVHQQVDLDYGEDLEAAINFLNSMYGSDDSCDSAHSVMNRIRHRAGWVE